MYASTAPWAEGVTLGVGIVEAVLVLVAGGVELLGSVGAGLVGVCVAVAGGGVMAEVVGGELSRLVVHAAVSSAMLRMAIGTAARITEARPPAVGWCRVRESPVRM